MPSQDKTLISEMIYYGKLHYLKDLLLPGTPNYQKIGYTAIQEKFCIEVFPFAFEKNKKI